jgi:hypothetical protein
VGRGEERRRGGETEKARDEKQMVRRIILSQEEWKLYFLINGDE